MTDQPINNDALAKTTVTFVIGATASGKTTFIQNCFSNNRNTVILNVYDYQQAAYKDSVNTYRLDKNLSAYTKQTKIFWWILSIPYKKVKA